MLVVLGFRRFQDLHGMCTCVEWCKDGYCVVGINKLHPHPIPILTLINTFQYCSGFLQNQGPSRALSAAVRSHFGLPGATVSNDSDH